MPKPSPCPNCGGLYKERKFFSHPFASCRILVADKVCAVCHPRKGVPSKDLHPNPESPTHYYLFHGRLALLGELSHKQPGIVIRRLKHPYNFMYSVPVKVYQGEERKLVLSFIRKQGWQSIAK